MKKCTKCGKLKKDNCFKKFRSSNNGNIYTRNNCSECRNILVNNPPKRRYLYYVKGAKERNVIFNINFEEFMSFWNKNCHYCGDNIKTIGLDRVDNNKGYEMNNIVPCCWNCNSMKRKLDKEFFIKHIEKIYNNFF